MEQRNVVSTKTLDATEAAYVAGFLDGEGTVTIGRETRSANRVGYRYHPCLMLANTNREGLEHVQRLCGNGRIDCAIAAKGRNQKPLYRLWFSANQIRQLLPQVRPFVFIKRPQIALLMRFLDLLPHSKDAGAEHWAAIEQLRGEIRALNYRGATKPSLKAARVFIREKKPPVRTRRIRGVCQITDCGRPHAGKGYCRYHYKVYVERGGPTRHERVCEHCGTAFITRYKHTRFCSKACNDKNYRVRKPSPS
jgi:hypothetical protein